MSGFRFPLGQRSVTQVVVQGDVSILGDTANLNSSGGTDNHEVVAIGLPGPTGHVVGGTPTNPFSVNIVGEKGAHVDDSLFTLGTDDGAPIMGYYAVAPDSVDSGDAGVIRMSANRNLFVNLRDAAGNERGLTIDANNRLGAVVIGGQVTGDSSVAPLGIGGVFIGPGFVVSGCARITGTVFADKQGVLQVQQSSDGNNYDESETVQVVANTGKAFSYPVVGTHARLVYTNGAQAQAVFRVYSFAKAI